MFSATVFWTIVSLEVVHNVLHSALLRWKRGSRRRLAKRLLPLPGGGASQDEYLMSVGAQALLWASRANLVVLGEDDVPPRGSFKIDLDYLASCATMSDQGAAGE